MKVGFLNTMLSLMWRHLENDENDRVEVLHFLAAFPTTFCLWMRTDELFNVKFKELDLNIEINDEKVYFYHKATMLRRGNDKKRIKLKPRMHDVHKFTEIEKGCCMKRFLCM